tara:strand:+ start:978 stop:1496 length:519 start_codon:yes stop_codon:yes gene_type:complete
MIYFSQTILTTNSELFIPRNAIIQASSQEEFTRNGVTTSVPSLVYSFLPVRPDSNSNDQPSQRVISNNNWNAHVSGLINDLVKIRVFLVPLATAGTCVCTYAIPTSNTHTITQYAEVELKSKRHYFFVETPSSYVVNPAPNAQPTRPPLQSRRESTTLGPAVRQNLQHRTIN